MEDKIVLLCQEETMFDHLVLKKETFGHKRNKTCEESQLHYPSELNLTAPINSKENSFKINKLKILFKKSKIKL